MAAKGKQVSIVDLKVIVIGDNFYWGKGETLEEAIKLASHPKRYVAYITHPDSTVDGMGGVSYPAGDSNRPKVIARKGIKQSEPAKAIGGRFRNTNKTQAKA
jgi:hypothetical protein